MKATCVFTLQSTNSFMRRVAHEQMRTDAEEYLNINGDQIMKGYHHNFIKDDDTVDGSPGRPLTTVPL